VSALLLILLLALSAAPARAQDFPGIAPSTLVSGGRFGAGEPSLLPISDEQKIERARNLVRVGYAEQAAALIDDVAKRHPDDLDVLLARAELISRTTPGEPVETFLAAQAARPVVAKSLAARPRRGGFWLRYEAEALAAEGREGEAAKKALAAWEQSPEQGSWARVRVEAWSADPTGVARELSRLADRHPERADLAMEAARAEAGAGRVRPAIERLRRYEAAEAKRAGDNPGDVVRDDFAGETGPAPAGSSLWQLALGLAARGEDGVDAADSVLVELVLGPGYDPGLRAQATSRLFDERVPAGPGDGGPPGGGWIEGNTLGGVVRLRVGENGRLEPAPPEVPAPAKREAAKPAAPVDEAAHERARLAALERVWRKLPPSPEVVRRGLDLSDRYHAEGDDVSARRVGDLAARMAPRTPGASADPELTGQLAVRRGESALASGDLMAAARAFGEARESGASEHVREQAQFLAGETEFYAGEFDSAAAAYDAFARAYTTSRYTNDALERMYLIESGDGGPVPGLTELAHAFQLARGGASDEALAAAAVAETRAANGPAWSHAGLLTASLLEARGRDREAAAKALSVAETHPDDRLAPVARRKAGDLYRASGQDALALAQYEELLVRYPRSWLAPETRRLVQDLRAKAGTTP